MRATAMPPSEAPLLSVSGLGKSFPGIRALDDVSFALHAGEVIGLVGENGAGKSTLIKILAGVYPDYDGTVRLGGDEARFAAPREACDAGIATIFQELSLVPDLDVTENVFLGREIVAGGGLGLIDRAAMRRRTAAAVAQLGVDIPTDRRVAELAIATRQLVEICKALVLESRIVVMDEPTSSLSQHEVDRLLDITRLMRSQGRGVIYVSHKLEEVFAVCDRVLVMRDGRLVLEAAASDLTPGQVVSAMVGRAVDQVYPERQGARGAVALQLRGLGRAGDFSGIDLDVHAGEIVALAGLVGAGRTELGKAIVGATRAEAGSVCIAGRPSRRYRHPDEALRDGIVYLSEDRKGEGLLLEHSLRENIVLSVLRRLARAGLVSRKAEIALSRDLIERLRIKAPGPAALANSLSGGNQQKVAIARLLATEARVFILDEPTRGVDVGAKAEIYRIVRGLAEAGRAVLLISSELPEVLGLADRIALVGEGRMLGMMDHADASPEAVMARLAGAPA